MRLPVAVVPFLQSVLSGQAAEWPEVDEATTARALAALRWHGAAPLVREAVLDTRSVAPPEMLAGLHAGYLGAVAGCAVMLPERERVAAALAEAGLPAALLKGAALAGWVYPDPALRPFGDLDVLVAEADMAPAAGALGGLGYRQRLEEAGQFHHHWVFDRSLGAATVVTVELHRRIVASPPYDRLLDTEALLGRAVPAAYAPRRSDRTAGDGGTQPAPMVLHPVDALIHLAAHLVLQHAGEERLIWVADVDRLSRHEGTDASWWRLVADRARGAELSLALLDSLQMCAYWFDTPVPPWLGPVLLAAARREEAAAYGRLRARAPIGREGARLFTDARGIRGAGGRARYALAYAFPPREYMRARHRVRRGWMLPIYYGRRLLRGVMHVLAAPLLADDKVAGEPPERRMIES